MKRCFEWRWSHWDSAHTQRGHAAVWPKGDDPVNPHAVTFLVTGKSCSLLHNINNTERCSVLLYSTVFCSVVGSKLDLRDYVEGVEAEQLDCELRRYSTEGIHVHWPARKPRSTTVGSAAPSNTARACSPSLASSDTHLTNPLLDSRTTAAGLSLRTGRYSQQWVTLTVFDN